MQKYIGTMPFNLWGHGHYIRLPGTNVNDGLLTTDRDQLIPYPEEGMLKFNLDRGWFEGFTGLVWRQFSMALTVEVYDFNGVKSIVEFLNMPFYSFDGTYTPIALNATQNVNFHLSDGTITYLEVK